jgi:ubiquitin-small subunit ribosomal protein S27Ae
VYGGKQLCEDSLLSSAGVEEGACLEFLGRLLGAGKKRKKKTYTKPKKNKHKHKNVKLRVLKYYSVDDSGKVTRTRKSCPTCGPGIFMATHKDRFHCGTCAMTFMYNKA